MEHFLGHSPAFSLSLTWEGSCFLGEPENAAKILHHNKVSKIGAFGGFNPTIDNPTQEYKAVIYAANELKPIPTEPFKTRSDYRSLQGDSVSADHRAVQRLSNLD